MRRGLLAPVIGLLIILVALGLPLRARTQVPGQGVPAPGLDPALFSLGELLEGNAPLDKVDLNAMPIETHRPLTTDLPLPVGYAVDFRHYPTVATINTFLDELERDYPTLVEIFTLGESWQGRPIRGIRIANKLAQGDLRNRPAMYIDGQHHARELISNQVALYTAWWLLDAYGRDMFATHLVDTRVLYVVPSTNPDGNDIVLADFQAMRKTANPNCCDDDFNPEGTPVPDGLYDEDYSIGFGYGTHELYLYHFSQAWADQYPDNPFQTGWQQNQEKPREYLGRHTGALGGAMRPIPRFDMDGDGLQDEDEIGGVDSNRNYAAYWDQGDPTTWSETYRGPAVWSEPETRAVRDFVLELDRLATGLSYHSGTDLILHPWGWSREADLPDAATFELLGQKGSQVTEVNGFPGSPHTWTARGLYGASGSTMDWLYDNRGVYSFSPEVYGGSSRTRLDRLGATGTYSVGTAIGFGFNPRPEEIVATTDRWNRFALYMLATTPNLELNAIAVEAGRLVVTVGNDGALPVEVTVSAEGLDGASIRGETQLLSAGSGLWEFDLAELPAAGTRLSARAWLPIGTHPHEVELAEWGLRFADGQVSVDEGQVLPFPDLGARFGGWWAPEAFDEPGRYHRPPNQPIPVTPPPSPTVGPSQTPRPTFTPAPTPIPLTATPTTPVRPPGHLALPWAAGGGP